MVLNHEHQLDLAVCVQEMFTHRESILEVQDKVSGEQQGRASL
jgi:hypothetical protein